MTSPNESNADGVSRRALIKRGLLTSTAVAVGLPAISNTVAAAKITVPHDYSSIQAAVDAASPGARIVVDGGTYREQVLIDKSLELEGRDATIEHPDSPGAFTIPESGPRWEPTIFAYGGSLSNGTVSGSETVAVSVSGFEVDGRGRQPGARRKPGIFYRNVKSPDKTRIENNTIKDMGVGGKETFGILAYGDTNVAINNNHVSDYERGGIGANGDGGAHPSPEVTVQHNTITGSTGIGKAWGPNGIQVGFGATGIVKNNTVEDNRYRDEGPVASGILVFESEGIVVQNNEVENADVGVSVGSWGWLRASADNTKVKDNTVTEAEYGTLLEAVAEPYGGVLTQMDPTVSNTKVLKNRLTGASDPKGQIGVGIIVEDNISNTYDPEARNNKIRKNNITNFDTEIEDQGSATKMDPASP
jgi:nitrous oxidase accessory protein NosD